jgi:hypothetical protein
VHANARDHSRVVFEQVGDRPQPPWQRRAALRVGLEDAELVSGGGKEIGNSVTHQAAADYADFLHLCLAAKTKPLISNVKVMCERSVDLA